tara:strand:- start:416 stop:643 length:228 start_codon:yes stop_codon:yes gene_type:complete
MKTIKNYFAPFLLTFCALVIMSAVAKIILHLFSEVEDVYTLVYFSLVTLFIGFLYYTLSTLIIAIWKERKEVQDA